MMSGDADLQAMAEELLRESQTETPSMEKVMQFDAMIRASGDTQLIQIWEQVLSVAEGGAADQTDLFQALEEAIRATGDATLIGKMELFKDSMQTTGGMSLMALVDLVEALEASGDEALITKFNEALDMGMGDGPFTLAALVKLGKAVRAVEDSTLENMVGEFFAGGDAEEEFASFIGYTTRKLAEALR